MRWTLLALVALACAGCVAPRPRTKTYSPDVDGVLVELSTHPRPERVANAPLRTFEPRS